jgi:ribosomal protein S6
MVSINFVVGPKALDDLNHNLKVNEDILRFVVLKMKLYDRLPRTSKELSKLREAVEQAQAMKYPPVPEGFEP